MKCIHCQTDSKHKDRSGLQCPNCKHEFAFEPQDGDLLTDVAFQAAVERVSSGGKVRWVERHLYHELRRTLRARQVGLAVRTTVDRWLSWVGAPPVFARALELNYTKALQMIARWQSVHGKLPGLLPPRATPAKPPDAALLRELASYSFDRAVITDSPEIVDVLVANRFHFENNCAILTMDGYPAYTAPLLQKMLRQNPKINVLALHSATPKGCQMAVKPREDPAWFAGVGTVVEVGLRPEHARFFPQLETALGSYGTEVGASHAWTPKEAQWLSRYSLELTVVRPEQLIKRLFRAITAVEGGQWESDSAGVIYMGQEASVTDGGGDSFG